MVQKPYCRVVGLIIIGLLVMINPAQAKMSKQEIVKLQESLKEAAQKFGEAYVKRNFKMMYEMLNGEYRKRVDLWEYKDFVHYDGISDGFVKLDIMDVIVLPSREGDNVFYGKVSQKISSVENVKTKTTGRTSKTEEEFIYWEDWVNKNGTWYKFEKLE